jgi:hypothetical protein
VRIATRSSSERLLMWSRPAAAREGFIRVYGGGRRS